MPKSRATATARLAASKRGWNRLGQAGRQGRRLEGGGKSSRLVLLAGRQGRQAGQAGGRHAGGKRGGRAGLGRGQWQAACWLAWLGGAAVKNRRSASLPGMACGISLPACSHISSLISSVVSGSFPVVSSLSQCRSGVMVSMLPFLISPHSTCCTPPPSLHTGQKTEEEEEKDKKRMELGNGIRQWWWA